MIRGLLADANADGYMTLLTRICTGPRWKAIWNSINVKAFSFADLKLPSNMIDSELWHICQSEELILLTANRNSDGPDSLEATIRIYGGIDSLPVVTISDAEQLIRDRDYGERAAIRLMEILLDIEALRGTGRLYIPSKTPL